MLKKTYKRKMIVLFLCSWFASVPVFAQGGIVKSCMDCASFTANIAKIFDTIYKFFTGGGNNNGREREEIIINITEQEYYDIIHRNGTGASHEHCRHFSYKYSKHL